MRTWVMAALGFSMVAAWMRNNWLEGRAIATQVAGENQAPRGGQVMTYFLMACLDDLPPSLLFFFAFRGFAGSMWAWIIGICVYGPVTFMYIRATGQGSRRPLVVRIIDKLMDDISDGWLGFGALAALFGWLEILIPAITITI